MLRFNWKEFAGVPSPRNLGLTPQNSARDSPLIRGGLTEKYRQFRHISPYGVPREAPQLKHTQRRGLVESTFGLVSGIYE